MINGEQHVFIVDNERTPIGVVNLSEMPNWVVPGYTVHENRQAHITHAVAKPEFDDSGGPGLPDDMVWVEGDKGPIGAVRVPEGDPYAGVMINGEQHVFIVDNQGTHIGLVNPSKMPDGVVPGYTFKDGNAQITHAVATPGLDEFGKPIDAEPPDDMVWVQGDNGPIGAVQVPKDAGSSFSVSIEGKTYYFQYENGGWCETSYEDAMSVLSGANSSGVFVNMGGADAPSGTPAQPTSNEVAQNSETVSEAQLTTDQVTATEAATAVAYGGIALSVVGRAVTQAGKIRQLADVLYSIGISDHNQSQANDSNGSNHEKLTQGGIEKLMAGVRSQQETAATKAGLAAIGAVGAGATAAVGGFASAAGIIGTARDVKNKAERFNNMATLRAKVTEKLEALNAKPTNVEQTTSPATQSGGATREPSDPLANSDNQQKLTELTFKVTGLLDEKGFRRTAGGIAGGLNTVLHAVTIASIPLGGFAPINILNKGVDAVKTFANNVQAERYLKENGSTISSSEVKKSNWEALKSLGNKWRKKEIKNNNDNEPEYKQAGRLVAKPVQLLGRLAVGLYKATTDTIVDAALAIPSAIEVLGRNRTDTVARLRGKSTEEFKDPIFCNNIKKGLKKGFDFGGGVSWLSDKWFGTFDQTKVRAFKEADIQQAFLDAYDGATEDQKKAIVRPLHN
jgi:hypothetical protein